jgi:type I restriction enzyme S subunit
VNTSIARVGELADQIRGVSYEKNDVAYQPQEGYLPVLRAGNITDAGLTFDDLVFVPKERISARQLIREGDVIIAASSGSLEVVGKAAMARSDFDGGFGAFCKVLRPNPSMVEPTYFSHYFQTRCYRSKISSLAAGANINNLKNEHLDDLLIPLPPIPEQRRIAAILDQADALRAKRRQTLTQLDEMARAIFVDMFGEPQTWSSRWPCRSFDETMSDETSRSIKLQTNEFHADGLFPIVDQGQKEIAGYSDNPAYLCVSRLPCIVFGDHTRVVKLIRHPFIVGADGAKVLVPREGIEATFLAYAMRFAPIPDLGYSRHMREVKRLSFPSPPMERQMIFARTIVSLESQNKALASSASELGSLFASLQHRAFRGEL